MRGKSYLARIVEGATVKRRQPALAPPRLLFRPGPTQFDVGMDAEPGSTRVRSIGRRDSGADGTGSGGDERGIWTPLWPTQRAEWLDSLERSAQLMRPRHAVQRTDSLADGARAVGSSEADSLAANSQLAASRPGERNTRAPGRPNMTTRTGDVDVGSGQGNAALRRRAFQTQTETSAEQRDSSAKAAPPQGTQHQISDTAKQASSRQQHDLEPTATATVQMRARKGDSAEGDRAEGGRAGGDSPEVGDELARSGWRQVTSERAPGRHVSPKAELAPRLDLQPKEPRRDVQARKEEGAGRVRIGTLELRILPPPNTPREVTVTPPPARRVAVAPQAAGPLARGFGVFGLPQS